MLRFLNVLAEMTQDQDPVLTVEDVGVCEKVGADRQGDHGECKGHQLEDDTAGEVRNTVLGMSRALVHNGKSASSGTCLQCMHRRLCIHALRLQRKPAIRVDPVKARGNQRLSAKHLQCGQSSGDYNNFCSLWMASFFCNVKATPQLTRKHLRRYGRRDVGRPRGAPAIVIQTRLLVVDYSPCRHIV
jgi:hypothetical protein